ncbi:MAG TPA: S8 family serine peptidase [candidate division Zixibacteria bacterium]|nr:S8 family peptidase [candidate division Zixibacteria bacterium]MDD4916492.1 S8 family serine peptidase [candidate division Zixibacteria bacterium]MDM7973366.1 S8 family serine peptidase [candidate division Zixibacteria bacterium]HPM38667.1 S8 family serine peptidase [candidate division Zixibacteria bacterium]
MIPHWTGATAGKFLLFLALAAAFIGLTGSSQPGPGVAQPPGAIPPNANAGTEGPDTTFRPYVPGEVVVRLFSDSISVDSINTLFGTTVKEYFGQVNIYILATADPAADIEALVENLRPLPGVIFAHPNYVVSPLQSVQGSFPFSDADNVGSYPEQEAALRLRLSQAHALATGAGVKVAVVDGGVNFAHPVLAGAAVSGWDYVDGDADAFDEPGGRNSGHGTFVAGVVHLTAPGAQIIAYRVADTSGRSNGDRVAEAILRAIDDGCRVVNLSLVMTNVHEVLRNTLAYARSRDVLVVAAAGNERLEVPTYPASDPNVVAVAAVDTLDRLAEFSRYGNHIDLCAPGEWIYAPYFDMYAWWSGTSFAAPFVAGQAALKVSQAGGALDWRSLHASLIATAENIYPANPGFFGKLGAGLANPLQALQDTVGIDTASVDPGVLALTLPPNTAVQRCFNLYSTNPNSVFNATVLGGNVAFTTITADSVLGANATICFTLSSSGLSEGIYADTIQFDISGVSNSPIFVPLSLYVSDTAVISQDAAVRPTGYSFWLPEGWVQTIDACAYLTSTNAPAAFTVRRIDTSAASFVEILSPSGMTNDSVCILLHPAGLAPGVHLDTLVYRVSGVTYDLYQPVSLTIGDQVDSAAVSPMYFYFTSPPGGPPQEGRAYLRSTNAPSAYYLETAGGSDWLHVPDSAGVTNDSISFTIAPAAGVVPGLYTDTLYCHVAGAVNTPAVYVTLEVQDSTAGATATAHPTYFEFVHAPWAGGPAQAGVFLLASTNAPASYSVEAALGVSWLHLADSIGTTNDSVRFTVDGAGLAPGFYWDSLICRVTGVEIPAAVQVLLTVLDDTGGTGPSAYASPSWFSFASDPQTPPYAGSFVLSSSNAPAAFTAAVMFSSPWLHVIDAAGTTNDSVRFTVDAAGLAPGFYSDSIACVVAGVPDSVLVPVQLSVAPEDTLGGDSAVAIPASFSLTAPQYSELLQVRCLMLYSSNAPAPFTASVRHGAPWLTLYGASGMTNDSVCFGASAASLGQGIYVDTIDCSVEGVAAATAVPVVFYVVDDSAGPGPSAWAAPPTVSITAPFGLQDLIDCHFVLSSTNAPAPYVAYAANGSAWLSVADSAGVTSDTVRLVINPAAPFSAGTYVDSIACLVEGVALPVTVPVMLTLTVDSGGAPTAAVTPATVHYFGPYGMLPPTTKCALVTSSNAPAPFTAWVADSVGRFTSLPDPTGVTADSLCLYLDPAGLPPGIHVDTVRISVAGVSPALTLIVQLSLDMPKVSEVTNYPNPFNPETNISFSLTGATRVQVTVYNTLGQEVAVLLDKRLEAGRHTVSWGGCDGAGRPAASGVYLYRITTDEGVVSRKMLLLK